MLGRVAQLLVQSGTLDPTPLFNPSASQYRTWTKLAEGTYRCERSVWVWRVSLKLAWSSAFSHTSSAVPQVDAFVSLFHMSAIRMKVAGDLVSRKEAEIVMAQPFGSSAGSIATGFLRSLQGARETLDQDSPCLPRIEGAVGVYKNTLVVERKGCHWLFLVSLFRWSPGAPPTEPCRHAEVRTSCKVHMVVEM